MPIIIPKNLPAFKVLTNENIFIMTKKRAISQDIRPIEIAIVNLMPTKIDTETQLMRLLGNSSLQINVTLINMDTYQSKNTPQTHLDEFYKTFDEVKHRQYDGMIVTGAPIEQMNFEEVAYWQELCEIMKWTKTNVTSTIYICWGAQAGLYYNYGINKRPLEKKLFGIYPVSAMDKHELLLKGVDDIMHIPMSRHTTIDDKSILSCDNIVPLAGGKDCGIAICKSKDNKEFYLFGHSEYDRTTLEAEYIRDVNRGLNIQPPINYYTDDTQSEIKMQWKSTANLIFYNWLNYYVYQVTPFEIEK